MDFAPGRIKCGDFSARRASIYMNWNDCAHSSKFLSRISSNSHLKAKPVGTLYTTWKGDFFSLQFADTELITDTSQSAPPAYFENNYSISDAYIRLASSLAISTITVCSFIWFWNVEWDSGAGFMRCSGIHGDLSSSDLKVIFEVLMVFRIFHPCQWSVMKVGQFVVRRTGSDSLTIWPSWCPKCLVAPYDFMERPTFLISARFHFVTSISWSFALYNVQVA